MDECCERRGCAVPAAAPRAVLRKHDATRAGRRGVQGGKFYGWPRGLLRGQKRSSTSFGVSPGGGVVGGGVGGGRRRGRSVGCRRVL